MNSTLVNIFLNLLTPQSLGAFIRWALGLAAGWLIAHGWLTSDQVPEVLAGAVAALVPIIWSLIQKARARQEMKVALSLPAGSTEQQAKQGAALERKYGQDNG